MHDHHWDEEDKARLLEVQSYEELAELALRILSRMEDPERPTIQVCGPMTTGGRGSFRANMDFFRFAIDRARAAGHNVFDQVVFQEAVVRLSGYAEDRPYDTRILDDFYHPVFKSGLVHVTLFLPKWKTSRGATWERELVTSLGIKVEEYPREWLSEQAT